MCKECYSDNLRITPLIKSRECLENHIQYICSTCGRCICINQDEKMYAASVLKLPYLYYAQEKINEGLYQLDTTVKYVSEVNDFPGSYKPEGSGSLPKKEDNKEYSLKDLITKVSKESDNVAHNILGY